MLIEFRSVMGLVVRYAFKDILLEVYGLYHFVFIQMLVPNWPSIPLEVLGVRAHGGRRIRVPFK